MTILHIIPSAFEYFDDIRARAFELLGELDKMAEVEVEAVTIQYGAPTKAEKVATRTAAPALRYGGLTAMGNVFEHLTEFDIIHLHCPFLGEAKKIIQWKQAHPDRPLVITYHRDVKLVDLFSLYIRWYNSYYLPKIFTAADVVSCFSAEEFGKCSGGRYLADKSKLAVLSGGENIHLTNYETVVKLMEIYNNLV